VLISGEQTGKADTARAGAVATVRIGLINAIRIERQMPRVNPLLAIAARLLVTHKG